MLLNAIVCVRPYCIPEGDYLDKYIPDINQGCTITLVLGHQWKIRVGLATTKIEVNSPGVDQWDIFIFWPLELVEQYWGLVNFFKWKSWTMTCVKLWKYLYTPVNPIRKCLLVNIQHIIVIVCKWCYQPQSSNKNVQ